jgi:hypothetical protein
VFKILRRISKSLVRYFFPKVGTATLDQILSLESSIAELARSNVDLRISRFPIARLGEVDFPIESIKNILTFSMTLQSQVHDLPALLPHLIRQRFRRRIHIPLRFGLEDETISEIQKQLNKQGKRPPTIDYQQAAHQRRWAATEDAFRKLVDGSKPKTLSADLIWIRGRESESKFANPIINKLVGSTGTVLTVAKNLDKVAEILLPDVRTPSKLLAEQILAVSAHPEIRQAISDKPDVWNQIISVLIILEKLKERIDFKNTKWIIGAFDKSIIGPALCELAKGSKASIINYQHGLVMDMKVLDLAPFDQFLAWDQSSKRIFEAEGSVSKITVTGNPAWNQLHELGRSHRPPEVPTLGLLLQITKGSLSTPASQNYLIETVLLAIKKRPSWKIAIRVHPSQNHRFHEKLLRRLPSSQVEIRPIDETLERFFETISMAVSVSSSAIVDAAAYGIPAAVVSKTDYSKILDMRFDGAIMAIHNLRELEAMLDSITPGPATPNTSAQFFEVNYQETVSKIEFIKK